MKHRRPFSSPRSWRSLLGIALLGAFLTTPLIGMGETAPLRNPVILPDVSVDAGPLYVNDDDETDTLTYDFTKNTPLPKNARPSLVKATILVVYSKEAKAYRGRGTVTVSAIGPCRLWADPGKVTPFAGTFSASPTGSSTEIWVEGLAHSKKPNDVTITATWKADSATTLSSSGYVETAVWQVDADVDTLNKSESGNFERSTEADTKEHTSVAKGLGKIILPNRDLGPKFSTANFTPMVLELKAPFTPAQTKFGLEHPRGIRIWRNQSDKRNPALFPTGDLLTSADGASGAATLPWRALSATSSATVYIEYVDETEVGQREITFLASQPTGINVVTHANPLPKSIAVTAETLDRLHVFLLPVEIVDVKNDGPADDQIILPMPRTPTKLPGELDEAFWGRRNAYFQQLVPDQSIAYIQPHRAANNSPDMPRLIARIPRGQKELKVRWRLEVEYLRGNGYRAGYISDFTRPEDNVSIPYSADTKSRVFTGEMPANQEWRIYESADWGNEIGERGFFGGTAKLFLWPLAQLEASKEPVITFRIGGINPEQDLARQFIDHTGGAQFWYCYAIARHETFGRVRSNKTIRFYNQFYTDYIGGPIGDDSVDMGWAAWAKGWPLYNLDRGRDHGERYQNGPGGYGIYQLTWGPKQPNDVQGSGSDGFVPRRMIWNWQENTTGAISELRGKAADAELLLNGLQVTYPKWPAIPNEGKLSALDAIVVTFYNGTAALPRSDQIINGSRPKTPWLPSTQGSSKIWTFHQNSQDYVQSVNAQINDIQP